MDIAAVTARGPVGLLALLLLGVGLTVLPAAPSYAARPTTTITGGPSGATDSLKATFTFRSNARGATFQCRLDSGRWKKCSSPKTYRNLAERNHTFKVRARKNGKVDKTPATRTFTANRPLTMDQATAEEAAAMYFPDSLVVDVPATCGGQVTVDCDTGSPAPAADQVEVTSTRQVTAVPAEDRFDVLVSADVVTLAPPVVTVEVLPGQELTCDVTVTSANGDAATWQVTQALRFVTDPATGALRIVADAPSLSGVEESDIVLSGSPLCGSIVGVGTDVVIHALADVLAAHVAAVGNPLCATPGPDYLGECPTP